MAKTLVLNGTNFSANKVATITFGESVPCTGITLDESTKSVTSMTDFTLVATPTPSNTTDSVVWTTSDSDVVTVASGVATPVGLGTATITATCGSYSATCVVTIDNVVPSYKAVCGYSCYRRTSTGDAATTGKTSTAQTSTFMIAADQETGLYPIESKTDVDTSPYRFVPILIPNGATKIIVSTTQESTFGKFKTRVEYFDSTKQETSYGNGGACVVSGSNDAYDQPSTQVSPIILTIPDNIDGLDSVAIGLLFQNNGTNGTDYSSVIKIAFSYGT